MIKIGIVDPDTSHPENFAPILHENGRARIVAIQSDYSVKNRRDTRELAARIGVEKVFDTVEEMLDLVDAGFIQGANWDTHLPKARPFLEAGKPVFIDKPLAGKISDCIEFENWSAKGAKILGCSSLRYCYEVRDFLATPLEERGQVRSVHAVVGTDEFNYGIHAVEMLQGITGPGAESVRFLGSSSGGCELYQIFYSNDIIATYQVAGETWLPFVATVTTTRNTCIINANTADNRIYRALLERVLEALEGRQSGLASVEELTETIRVCLAGRLSKRNNGAVVRLDEIPEGDPGYDGEAFVKLYAAQWEEKKHHRNKSGEYNG